MNTKAVQVLALIYAQVALLEGMKAENIIRQSRDYSLAYDDKAFHEVYLELERLAELLREEK
jgi:hypothetical protein